MKTRILTLSLLAALSLAACDDNEDAQATATGTARSLISTGTNETAEPVDINGLALSQADTTDTTEPVPVN